MASRVIVYESRVISLMQVGDGARWTRGQAKDLEAAARRLAPSRTGRLRDSHVTLPTVGSNQYQKVYRVSAMAYYAAWVHEGTGIYGPLGRPFTGRNGWMKIPGVNPNSQTRGPRVGTVVRWVQGQRPQPWLQRAADLVF